MYLLAYNSYNQVLLSSEEEPPTNGRMSKREGHHSRSMFLAFISYSGRIRSVEIHGRNNVHPAWP
jgi:hypothetical protein